METAKQASFKCLTYKDKKVTFKTEARAMAAKDNVRLI